MNDIIPLVAVTGGLKLGGSSTFLVNLARAFHEKGLVLPIVILSEHNDHVADLASFPSQVISVSHRGVIYEDRLALAYQEIARRTPQAVLACLSSESFELLRVVPSGCGRIGIIQSDEPGPYAMSRCYGPWLDAMVGVSTEISRKLRTFPEFSHCRIQTIPYGISFPHDVRKRELHTGPLRIIYLGRMIEEQKRVSRLVELVRVLEQRGDNCRFTFAGTGDELPRIREALAGSRITDFLGPVPNTGVSDLLRRQDIYILLSDYEGLPLSLLEAMGQGVVPIVSDIESGIREVVTAETGIRVPTGNVAAAANAISSLAGNPNQLQKLSFEAMRLARGQYSSSRMADNFLTLVSDLRSEAVKWTVSASIPAPLGLPRWLYSGFPRECRRIIKRAAGGHSKLECISRILSVIYRAR